MKKFLILYYLILECSFAFPQGKPYIYKQYINNDDRFIIDNLILSSDGLFFSFASCECGKEYYAKGNWKIKKNKLYLDSFDSTLAFPNSKISFINSQQTDSVIISGIDYFGKPMTSLLLGLIYKDSTISRFYEFVDNSGRLKISKKEYIGFFLIYEMREATGLLANKDYYHFFGPDTKEALIHIDFAAAGFDREPVTFKYPNKVFRLKSGGLFGKGSKPVFKEFNSIK